MRKGIEWLKEEIKVFQEGENMFTAEFNAGVQQALEYVQEIIDQLDEPETLNEEWIENHTASADTISYYSEDSVPVVTVSNLKGLLVPNQDKPVIPQFVADWYEENLSGGYTNNRNKFSGNDVFRVIQDVLDIREGFNTWEDYNLDEKIVAWAEENEEDFIHLIVNCSYKDGYEVEKEKRYHVVNKENYFLLRKYDGLVDILHTLTAMSRDEFGKDTRFMLTEQEIKDYDERFLVFAEEVTE